MKLLAILTLCASGLFGQNAVYNNFSPTVKGITISTYHCYFWLHASAPSPWDNEIACYSGSSTPLIMVGLPGVTIGLQTLKLVSITGTITFSFTPNAMNSAQTDYVLTGQGPSDGMPLVITGTI